MNGKNENWQVRNRRNVIQLAIWTFGWVATQALVVFGSKFIWDYHAITSILFILLNTVLGAGMIWMNIRYIHDLDEMQKKIATDSMALALGVGVVGGLSYSMLDITNVISFDAEISHVVVIMAITYLLSIFTLNSRYQ